MKRLIFAAALLLGIFSIKQADAQLSININIDSQPDWGPTGYDHVDYYYLPDIDCYYYVPGKQFVYQDGSRWVWRPTLPPQYQNYDLYKSYKVVVNKPKPFAHDADYRTRYSSYKGRNGQAIIRDSHDEKYKRHADNSRPESRPAPVRKPVQPAPEHRPATGDHRAPVKSKPAQHSSRDKKDDHGHH